ncbi:MAG TPA: helix-turn-helix domain-containing protein [Mycobacteriales bacterium]|jgi:AcrR family transcriptional regulator|nr:helix-turn-helix domain-containing protein [Mycobacteriales bacterium]
MTSIRHTDQSAILDAARDSMLAVGVRRTTLTDVARRAGISRMTLYRRYPDVTALFSDLMIREFGEVLSIAIQAGMRRRTARNKLVAEAVAGVRALHGNPLFAKVLDLEPELLLPYVVDRVGANQRMAIDRFSELLRAGHADGSIRRGEPADQALALLLVIQSFVLGGRAMQSELDPSRLLGELERVLDSYLCPTARRAA